MLSAHKHNTTKPYAEPFVRLSRIGIYDSCPLGGRIARLLATLMSLPLAYFYASSQHSLNSESVMYTGTFFFM